MTPLVAFGIASLAFSLGWLLAIVLTTNGLKADIEALDREHLELQLQREDLNAEWLELAKHKPAAKIGPRTASQLIAGNIARAP